jgi:hypothetical protein
MPPVPGRTRPPSPPLVAPTPTAVPYDADGLAAALAAAGWPCAVVVRVALDPLPPALLEKLAVSGRLTDGFVPIGSEPTWVGQDTQRAAAAFKGRLVATDRTGALWVLRGGPDGAVLQLVAQPGPGTTIWRSANVVWPVRCGVVASDVKALVSGRSPGDWPSGEVVDFELARSAGARRLTKPS